MNRLGGLLGILFIWLIAWSAKRMQEVGKAARRQQQQSASRLDQRPTPQPQAAEKPAAREQRLRDRARADRLDPRTEGFAEFVSSEHQQLDKQTPRPERIKQSKTKLVQAPAAAPREVIPRVSASPVVQAIVAAEILNRSVITHRRGARRRRFN